MTAFARFSLRNRALVALAAIIAVVGGLWSAATLKQELIPDFELPVVVVVTPYPGASPDVVDEQVSAPISQAATAVEGLESTSATSNANVSTVVLELAYGTEAGTAQQQMQVALSRLSLPESADPQVIVGSFDDLPVVQLAVTAPSDPEETVQRLREVVVPELEALDGVREVSLSGASDDVVTIDVDATALAMAGLSPEAISTALDSYGMVMPAGTLRDDGRALNVQVGQALVDVDDVAALPLRGADGEVLRLDEVAEVSVDQEQATSFARTNGQTSFGLAVTATPEGNTVEISDQVAEILPELEQLLGQGAQISVIIDQAPFITQSVEDLTVEGMLGLLFAVIVILIFLRAWRPTGVTALSIPLSLLITLIGVNVVGYTLNLLTLAALTVSIGRVVDDSIVVIENIERHLSYGGAKHKAVLTGVREVAGAITSATVATAAVFVPIGLVGGLVGELFRPFAFTAAAALLVSLLVALTIVPVLAWWFLPVAKSDPAEHKGGSDDGQHEQPAPDKQAEERRGALQRGYLATLRPALAHPVITLLIAVGLLGGTVALVPQLETEFIGDSGDNTLSITQTLPSGTSLQARDDAAAQVETILDDVEEVQTYQVTGGQAEGVMAFVGAGQDAMFMLSLDLDADAAQVQQRLREEFENLGPEAGELMVSAGQAAMAGGLEVVVTAPDSEELTDAAQQVRDAIADLPDTTDVTSNLAEDLATVTVTVDRDAAAEVGLTEAMVGQSVAAALNGIPLGRIITDTGENDVVMQIGDVPMTMTELAELPVGSVPAEPVDAPEPGDAPGQMPGDLPEGPGQPDPTQPDPTQPDPIQVAPPAPVLLADIAEVQEVDLPASITRSGGIQSATITAASTATDLGAQGTALQEALDGLDLPEGASAEIGGVMADQDEAFANLGLALLLSLAIVYLVMVGTFRSLVQPLILMISVPFAATGSIGLLLITGTPLGVAGLVGALMLVGVVVTNAIVLIDLINQYRRAGMGLARAIEEGARHRLRPILMTAFATMGALVPMALGITGGGAFISQPLALVVIGGLFTSTILTLVLVPVLYRLVEARKERRGVDFSALDAFDAEPAAVPAPPASAVAAQHTSAGDQPPPGEQPAAGRGSRTGKPRRRRPFLRRRGR